MYALSLFCFQIILKIQAKETLKCKWKLISPIVLSRLISYSLCIHLCEGACPTPQHTQGYHCRVHSFSHGSWLLQKEHRKCAGNLQFLEVEAFFSFGMDFFCFGRKLRSQKHECKMCNAGRKWLSSQRHPQRPGLSVMVLLMGSGPFCPGIVPFASWRSFYLNTDWVGLLEPPWRPGLLVCPQPQRSDTNLLL